MMNKTPKILDLIKTPKDLRHLNDEELSLLADEIREKIIDTTSKTGGHVASSLGTVEIILAVHSLINSPHDKFIFDVGHQSYAHKMVTGRAEVFDTLRNSSGISGFTKPAESKHDVHYSGHASDSLSIAQGLAKARSLRGSDEKVVALIGDASIAGGMSFEALNEIGQEKLPMVIILNENTRSISPTVGGLRDHLDAIRVTSSYRNTRKVVKENLSHLGALGQAAIRFGSASKDSIKQFLLPHSVIFEELGITCTPAIDGHNIGQLRRVIARALDSDGPVLVHVVTVKGAGYKPAMDEPEKFHGIGAYNKKTGKPKAAGGYTFTSAFSDAIIDVAKHDDKVMGLTAAMSKGCGLDKFEEVFPERFIDVGIAEQHLVGCAAGLSIGGYKPVMAVYSAFLQRAIDQMITNIALPRLNAVFCIDRAGIVGVDGVTHHGAFDISYGVMIPNMRVITPSCAYELKCALKSAIEVGGPFIIRYPKDVATDISDRGNLLKNKITKPAKFFEIGSSRELAHGGDVSILAFGSCVKDALLAAQSLKKKKINARVIDMRFAKPIDRDAVANAALETHRLVTVEDGIITGGAGSAVVDALRDVDLLQTCKVKCLGIDDAFVSHGTIAELKSAAGYDAAGIEKAVLSF